MYAQTFDRLSICALTQEQHERTCGYWYTVQNAMMAHTAFATKAEAMRWLERRGLTIEHELPEAGEHGFQKIIGSYRRTSHMDVAAFSALQGEIIPVLDNAQYTKGIITIDADGIRIVHHLNCNAAREVYDYQQTRQAEQLAA